MTRARTSPPVWAGLLPASIACCVTTAAQWQVRKIWKAHRSISPVHAPGLAALRIQGPCARQCQLRRSERAAAAGSLNRLSALPHVWLQHALREGAGLRTPDAGQWQERHAPHAGSAQQGAGPGQGAWPCPPSNRPQCCRPAPASNRPVPVHAQRQLLTAAHAFESKAFGPGRLCHRQWIWEAASLGGRGANRHAIPLDV